MGFSASPGLRYSKCGAKPEATASLGLSLEETREADFPPLCPSAVWVLSLSHTAKQREVLHPPKARRKLSRDEGGPIVVAGVRRCDGCSVSASLEMQSLGGHGILMEPPGREASMDHYQKKECTKTAPLGNQSFRLYSLSIYIYIKITAALALCTDRRAFTAKEVTTPSL